MPGLSSVRSAEGFLGWPGGIAEDRGSGTWQSVSRGGLMDLRLRQRPLQLLDSGVGDPGAEDAYRLKLGQVPQVRQPDVGDPGAIKAQLQETALPLEVREPRVG